MKQAQINMVFTFIATLIIIGVIVLVAVNLLGGTMKDKCTADMVVFSDKLKEALRTNNDYGAVNQQTFLSPCDYRTICFVDAKAITDDVTRGTFQSTAGGFPGEALIKDSVGSAVQANIFLLDTQEMVVSAGFSPQLELENPHNATCISARQGKFTLLFEGKGRTTLLKDPSEISATT
jgi:hypothetical protein